MKKTAATHSIILLALLAQWQIGAIVHFYGPLHAVSSCCQMPEHEREQEGHDADNCIFLIALTSSPTTVLPVLDSFILSNEQAHIGLSAPVLFISPSQPLYRLSPAQSPPLRFRFVG